MVTMMYDTPSLFWRVCDRYYFVASVVKANGSLEYAAGMAGGGLRSQRDNGLKRAPKKMPSISRDGTVDRCFHHECRKATGGPHFHQGGIRHGTYCNGNEQPWEAGKQICDGMIASHSNSYISRIFSEQSWFWSYLHRQSS